MALLDKYRTGATQQNTQPTTGSGVLSKYRATPATQSTDTTGVARVSSRELKTTEGLKKLAGPDVEKKLPKQIQGEDPEEIFSGGWVQDTFDALNYLQHGVTGMMKGEGWKEGVRTRASFSEDDSLGQYGAAGTVAGIVADILVDPLTYLGGVGLIKRGVTAAGKGIKASKAFNKAKELPGVSTAGRKLIYAYDWSPEYKKMYERMKVAGDRSVQQVMNFIKPFQKIDNETLAVLGRSREAGLLGKTSNEMKILSDVAKGGKITSGARDIIAKHIDSVQPGRFARGDDVQAVSFARESIERTKGRMSKATESAEDLREAATLIVKNRDFARAGLKGEVGQKVFQQADDLFRHLDGLSKEFAETFPMSKEMKKIFMDNIGQYRRRAFRVIEEGKRGKKAVGSTANVKRVDQTLLKHRKDLPDDVLAALDKIDELGYPDAMVMAKLARATENAKFFRDVSTKFASDVAQDGFTKLPNSKGLGHLADKYVPDYMHDYLTEMVRPRGAIENATKNLMAKFKYSKVILNPATHARNIMSNQLLNSFEGLMPGHPVYTKAAAELVKKGKYYQEANKFGLGVDSYAAQEITNLLIDSKALSGGPIRNAAKKIADLYQKEEEFAKMAMYIFRRQKGDVPEAAWKVAERATFNYAQVTPFIRSLRESLFGAPFITFTYKATPQVVKTALTHPERIGRIGKVKEGIENMGDQEELQLERAVESPWMRSGYYVKLPQKDEQGRSVYLDLTYILPYGDIASGNMFERGIKRETGLQEGVPEAAVGKFAVPGMLKELITNQDFYGNKVFRESDTMERQVADITRHVAQFMLPPWISGNLPGGYREDGTRREGGIQRALNVENEGVESGGAQTRNLQQEIMRALAGLKVQPINLEKQTQYSDWTQKKALETILQEQGRLKQFTGTYQPK